MAVFDGSRPQRPDMNPYLAGIGVGFSLLAAFLLMGRGLGASGGYTVLASAGVEAVAPEHARTNDFYAGYLDTGDRSPLADWILFELLGVTIGGAFSGWWAGRLRFTVERGPRTTDRSRLVHAFGGGVLMGVGAKFARGCTSGQAITGGALLSVGSWLFIVGAFGAGYACAFLFRRQWL